MSQPIKRHLRVGGAPQDDESKLLVRMHPDDVPKGMKFNRYIHLSTGNARITCMVRNNELAEIPHPRVHHININRKLRENLHIKSGAVYNFYVSKAPSWKAPLYIIRYHPRGSARRNMSFKLFGAFAFVIAIIGTALYYSLWY